MKDKNNPNNFLGEKAKDIVTGFEGIIVSHTRFLTGTDRVSIQPESDGKTLPAVEYFDIERVEVIDVGKDKA